MDFKKQFKNFVPVSEKILQEQSARSMSYMMKRIYQSARRTSSNDIKFAVWYLTLADHIYFCGAGPAKIAAEFAWYEFSDEAEKPEDLEVCDLENLLSDSSDRDSDEQKLILAFSMDTGMDEITKLNRARETTGSEIILITDHIGEEEQGAFQGCAISSSRTELSNHEEKLCFLLYLGHMLCCNVCMFAYKIQERLEEYNRQMHRNASGPDSSTK